MLSCRPRCAARRQLLQLRRISTFAVGDLVLLRHNQDSTVSPILTKPLKQGASIATHRGNILHDDIIGKGARDIVKPSTSRSNIAGSEFRLHHVTLEEYVRLSKRLVTPIYGGDCAVIVNLLDLHPDPSDACRDSSPPLEILEAGTGHGALTLYLSRAIHAANPPRPSLHNTDHDPSTQQNEQWKSERKAIIHTIDVSAKYSAHAQKTVAGYRRGIYSHNVDFHVGDVSQWLAEKLSERKNRPFLSHAILDMPRADDHIASAAGALVVDGNVVIFNPSITQIVSAATRIKAEKLPLHLEKVIELGVNGASSGREWDVRFVRPRAKQDAASGVSNGASSDSDTLETHLDGETHLPHEDSSKLSIVCRPKVGERIVGGGFIALWKKRRDTPADRTATIANANVALA